jgi:hypothetical protein
MTDLAIDGTATPSDGAFLFQATRVGRSYLSRLALNVSADGGSISGESWSTGQGTHCGGGSPPENIEINVLPGASYSNVSFATAGRITGAFNGTLQVWNVFGDGGQTQQRTYTFSIVPR